MPDLWRRSWSLTLGRLRIASTQTPALDVEFQVEKDTTAKPNKLELKVYNLSEQHREMVGASDAVELRAGYVDLESTIFSGQARDVWSGRDGADIVTQVEAEDAGTGYRTGSISRAFARGATPILVARACCEAMGVGDGNVSELASADAFAQGYTAQGPAHRVLSDVVRAAGMTWSVQDGVLQLRRGRPVNTRAVLLTPASGLVGSPAKEQTKRGSPVTYKAKALMMPGLYPGRVVRIEAGSFEANLQIKRARYVGATGGEDWSVDMVLEEYGGAAGTTGTTGTPPWPPPGPMDIIS